MEGYLNYSHAMADISLQSLSPIEIVVTLLSAEAAPAVMLSLTEKDSGGSSGPSTEDGGSLIVSSMMVMLTHCLSPSPVVDPVGNTRLTLLNGM